MPSTAALESACKNSLQIFLCKFGTKTIHSNSLLINLIIMLVLRVIASMG